ncbi:hypothetical protein [Mycoavidus sp. SF9855]|nr:hypothetical protein [Mycoavidus sp. SF9855]UUM21041.1 hypothetical protein NQD60_06125 [Mycoavidus sp. SF9855]
MNRISRELLKHLASKYIWWKTPDEAMLVPQRVSLIRPTTDP